SSSTSSPQKPNTGQAPARRNVVPSARLAPPATSSNAKKPLRLSERCGVSTAEKIARSWVGSLSGAMELTIPELWLARHLAGWPAELPARRRGERRRARASPARARRLKSKVRPSVRPPTTRPPPPQLPPPGARPKGPPAEIEEAFRRFKAARPEPKGELEHINPFTLLVAVVLSAQATDAGVNKATPALFAAADTPEKMAALG